MILRMIVRPNSMWLQFLPAATASVWALLWFRRNRTQWDWLEHGSLLMLVSVVVAPYSWYLDQVVLLPALLPVLYRTKYRSIVSIFALLSAATEIGNFRGVPLRTLGLYLWTAPVWLGWYLLANWADERQDKLIPISDQDEVTRVPENG
jgi:hypothetical protein